MNQKKHSKGRIPPPILKPPVVSNFIVRMPGQNKELELAQFEPDDRYKRQFMKMGLLLEAFRRVDSNGELVQVMVTDLHNGKQYGQMSDRLDDAIDGVLECIKQMRS